MRSQHHETIIDGLSVCITFKSMKHMRMRLSRQGDGVELSVPWGTPDTAIVDLVRSKRGWIDERMSDAAISPMTKAEQATEEEIAAWRSIIEPRTEKLVISWAPIIGVGIPQVSYRNMRSRWGSCTPDTGRIRINTRLALYPEECLELVVVHELCHFIERGHGPRFKALMDTYLPDWRDRRSKLR